MYSTDRLTHEPTFSLRSHSSKTLWPISVIQKQLKGFSGQIGAYICAKFGVARRDPLRIFLITAFSALVIGNMME